MTLPNDLEALVQKRLATGAYRSAEDVVRDALLAQDAEEQWSDEDRLALDAAIDHALAQVDRGEVIPGDQVRERLRKRQVAWLAENPVKP